MNVFVPYKSPIDCAKALYGDKRFNKQILECQQILKAINGETKAWANHPCTKMYAPHKEWLYNYMMCLSFFREYKKGNEGAFKYCCYYDSEANKATPPFLTDDFCNQHKRRLFTKAPELYPQFAGYGTSEVNWYVVDGVLLKYKDGKMIKS